ncbi:hypothetical protein PR001_g2305 [Phytophthora rubi]|uniref:Reverse transcriptase Ty1/copia-type domain-containing protein n=1 Tax=Phytophthora rubi TaxID=129364 RepID=A0A6A3P9A7_9STRA|nr:hypothetical protein PR002_g2277 [Phytophthora rubi]KAE9050544.1 hypothetical protein PR001_g2305 [Phytophthora rubi]
MICFVTGTQQVAVDAFFGELEEFSVKNLGRASKFVGMRVAYDDEHGYDLDQQVMILEMLNDHGIDKSNCVRTPIGPGWNEVRGSEGEKLPVAGSDETIPARKFQSLVGNLMWVVRRTRPDIHRVCSAQGGEMNARLHCG